MPETLASRFRGYLPVVIDVETTGLNPDKNALLEIAAIMPAIDKMGKIYADELIACHVLPFEGAVIDPKALEINGIADPYHPFRYAITEKEALEMIFKPIRKAMKKHGCHRAVLVGHNPTFDLNFIQAAVKRCEVKRSPFHPFTTFDTATLAAMAFGHTVLAVACERAGIDFKQEEAHSAIYDTQKTAELFFSILNQWDTTFGKNGSMLI